MAGSYTHVVNEAGELRQPGGTFEHMIENLGDAYEAIEEMYGMIWWLAKGDPDAVAAARQEYENGLNQSPGAEVVR